MDSFFKKWYNYCQHGGIAQPVRALASHARGPRFESVCLHHVIKEHRRTVLFYFIKLFFCGN